MKSLKYILLPYTFLFASVACLTAPIAAQSDDYDARMRELLLRYDKASDAAGRRPVLNAMTDLDKKYRGEAIIRMWNNLDEKTATAADYRRTGIAMAAGGEKKAYKWCFRKGAELGDPYCANQTLLEQLEEINHPEAALYLFPKIKFYTLPLLHNMALALYVLDTPESRKIARQLAEKFFILFDDKKNEYNVYDCSEYISYHDTDILKAAGKCWRVSRSRVLAVPGKILREFYEKND